MLIPADGAERPGVVIVVYLVRRLALTFVLMFAVSTTIFMMLHMLPGDPVMAILGGIQSQPTMEQIEAIRHQLGLDEPLGVQYITWLSNLIRGDLGSSLITSRPIIGDLALRFPRTLQLVVSSLALSVPLGIGLGIVTAQLRGRGSDAIISATALVGFSTPVFVVALLMIIVFSLQLDWFPSQGYYPPSQNLSDFLRSLVLPSIALAIGPIASTMRLTRAAMVEQLGLDYVRTARSKGLPERVVVYRHALKNALMPVVTVVGLQIGHMFGGSVIVESIFNWPGVGNFLIKAIIERDYPVVQGVVLIIAGLFMLINLATDLFYAVLDPRIRVR